MPVIINYYKVKAKVRLLFICQSCSSKGLSDGYKDVETFSSSSKKVANAIDDLALNAPIAHLMPIGWSNSKDFGYRCPECTRNNRTN